ncbi:universal stress protein [Rhodococcus kronopolitis]|uniref:Universal stress protein n=1 Tax=Rhodococcus kronopolitis TaxID=1460226 RepID=A0ABV9FXS6_9NOCA
MDGRPASTRLVVGYDRHPASHSALTYAAALTERLDAHLHVVHVVDVEDMPVDPDSPDWEQRVADVVAREHTEAGAALAAISGRWTYHLQHGNPADLLSSVADEYDASMILIGAPRHGLMSRMERLLGESVSAHLVQHGRRPVVLVPEHTQAPPP